MADQRGGGGSGAIPALPAADRKAASGAAGGEAVPPAPAGRPIYKRPWVLVTGAAVLLVGGYFGARALLFAYHHESTDDAFLDGHVVQISPKVSGYVTELRVTDNQPVARGDVLLVIDPRDYVAARDLAKAAADAARSRFEQARAQVETSRATLAAARANAKTATANLGRAKEEFNKGVLDKQSYDSAVSTAKSADATVGAGVANLATAELKVHEAEAAVAQAEAQLRQAELDLGYTTITAPVTGRVTRRTVERGNYLQPGQALLALVEPDLWVTANFKETQLTHMRPGQPVTVRVDAYPDRLLAARVNSFQRGSGARFSLLPAENATGNYVKVVQRVPVKLVFDDPLPGDMVLGPGMSVVPDVRVR